MYVFHTSQLQVSLEINYRSQDALHGPSPSRWPSPPLNENGRRENLRPWVGAESGVLRPPARASRAVLRRPRGAFLFRRHRGQALRPGVLPAEGGLRSPPPRWRRYWRSILVSAPGRPWGVHGRPAGAAGRGGACSGVGRGREAARRGSSECERHACRLAPGPRPRVSAV